MTIDKNQLRKTAELQKLMRDPSAVMDLLAERDRLKAENEALRNAFRPLLANWDDLKAGESINVDAARAAMGKGEQS
ncbi:hypothetical protein HX787_07995 [Pseudomonas tolaasii]|uniref:Uncharacterized protein n=1 Tax=Pseudomonas tolaasii TaxID=29442 RepID=A0A7Y8DQA7_PSETO|nr:hypothetical protein [Pseudomonas tolaasii]NWC20368.1 hypothetical protein [Pseudomonas tolaasii]NWC38370.1 hypothetical protein [Pseudomonas tolaasii]NWD35795.1 hypothetical protein [Pseudomonas tolaasii]